MFIPKSSQGNGLYISKSFGPKSHFEDETEDVLDLYR